MDNIQEIWKDIDGFEGLYEISNKGRVKTLKPRRGMKSKEGLIAVTHDSWGYPRVLIYKDKKVHAKRIHRLVAINFIPNPLNKVSVNHIDGNKLNNHVDNLEWSTWKENSDHAVMTGLNKHRYDVCKRLA